MSGHSKWATTKHRKAVQDAKRSNIFTKLCNAITVAAAQGGGDPETNWSLKSAIDKARSASVPKDKIEKAIKRGTGELEGSAKPEEIMYEGYGPGKVAVMISCLTDNKNRSSSEMKHVFSKHGGSMGGPNSVAWQFKKFGVIETPKSELSKDFDEFSMEAIEAGAEDIKQETKQNDDGKVELVFIYTKPENLKYVSDGIEKLNVKVSDSYFDYIAKDKIDVSEGDKEKIEKFFEDLDENNDVLDYYTNMQD